MPEHAQNTVIAAWIWNLQQIKKSNGYNNTIRGFYDPPVQHEDIKEFPAVNLQYGTEDAANNNMGSHTQSGANKWIYECNFPIIMDFMLMVGDKSDIRKYLLRMKYDIQYRFGQGTNYCVPDADGNATCFRCIYLSSTPIYIDAVKPNCAIQIVYDVKYRHKSESPDTLA